MRLTELLSGLNALKENADQRYVLIRRKISLIEHISVVSADAVQAFQAPGSSADPLLQSRDVVIVFSLQADRGVALTELLEDLRSQARDKAPPPVVSISGRTRAPGEYPLEPNMRISDSFGGGGLDEAPMLWMPSDPIRYQSGDPAAPRLFCQSRRRALERCRLDILLSRTT